MRIVTPQPVTQGGFTRSTTATFVGSNGLIQLAAINEPRIDYDPVTLASKGLLLEEARTNLLTYSEDLRNTTDAGATRPWIYDAVSIAINTTTSPDGATTADTVIDAATNSVHRIYQQISVTSGTAVTMSFYAKAKERTQVVGTGGAAVYGTLVKVIYDLSAVTATVQSGTATATITDVGNGWRRCTWTATPSTTTTGNHFIGLALSGNDTYLGNGTSGAYVWGAQIETGAFVTSYIPTTTASVLRGADALTQTGLIYSNVPISETLWTAGTYTTGTQRYEGTTLYEVVASPSTTDQPSVGAAKTVPTWKVVSAINRYKMFDNVISTQSTQTGQLVITVYPNQVVNAAAFFGLSGNTINVVMTDPVEGVVYNETKTLQDNTLIADWYAYFFEGIYPLTDAVFTDLPSYFNATITVIIDAGAATAACGEMVIGRQSLLGVSNFGTSVSIQDYSIKTTDDYGNIVVQQRAYSKRADYDVTVETNRIPTVQKLLADIRTTPTVFIGEDDKPETVVYGFYKQFNIVISTPSISDCSIEVEGLV